MSDTLKFILIMAGLLLAFSLAMVIIFKMSIKNAMKRIAQKESPEGYIRTEENAYIISANHTAMMMANYPVLDVQIAIFPQEGPMLLVNKRRTCTYAEIPYLRVGEPVRVSYCYNAELAQSEEDNSNAVSDISILGPSQVQWEGDPRVKEAATLLVSRIEGSKLIDTHGKILSIEKTNALLGGNPVFRYDVRFLTEDGQWVEGETYQAARPWLERERHIGSIESVQYSATNHNDFIFEKR